MNTIGVMLLAAATATSGIGKPHVGGKKLLRSHAVTHGAPPPGGMIDPSVMGAGANGAGAEAAGRRFPNTRSQIFFVDPTAMQIGWQTAGANGDRVYLPSQLVAPARYNFTQGFIYRLKITNLGQGRENLSLYPTLEVAPSTPATDAYLTHNPIPVQFTEEDFDQVQAGNFVTKVIYLPDPRYQEVAVSGVETLVSTRLEPGVDPVLEADKRGTILLIVRLGGIDLEMPSSNGGANYGGGYPGTAIITNDVSVPLGPNPAPFNPPQGTTLPIGPLDTEAPVSPAPSEGTVPTVPAPGNLGDDPSARLPGLSAPGIGR